MVHQDTKRSCLSVFYKHKKGGFNKRLYRLYLALAKRDCVVHCVAVQDLPIKHPNIVIHVLRAPAVEREGWLFWMYFLLIGPCFCFWVAWKYNIETLVVFSGFYAFICGPTRMFLGARLVTFVRADLASESSLQKKSSKRIFVNLVLEKIGLKLSNIVIPNSKTLGHSISRRHKIAVPTIVPNDIDCEFDIGGEKKKLVRKKNGLKENEFVVATMAPLSRVKNIGFLVKAISKVGIEGIRLLVIGDDLDRSEELRHLQKRCADLGVHDKTLFVGWLEEPLETLASADLFVFPSLQEGCPNALLEGLSCNIPCLGNRIPEISEVLRYDELLFSVVTSDELVRKIRLAATDRAYYETLLEFSLSCKKHYEFDWDHIVAKLVFSDRKTGRG